jgi:hypothetical protein
MPDLPGSGDIADVHDDHARVPEVAEIQIPVLVYFADGHLEARTAIEVAKAGAPQVVGDGV